MIYDPSRGISITYNHLNLPLSMVINSNHKIDYIYDASGNKLREIVTDIGSESYSTTKDNVDDIEYKDSKLEAIAHDNGRWYNVNVNNSMSTVSLRHEYCLKDHLGNTRLTFTDKDLDGKIEVSSNPSTNEILSEHHYYSFGLPMMGPWMNGSVDQNTTRYTYNGKEAIEGLDIDLLDYGARFYDPSIGRFTSTDPLADHPKQVDKSPYAYAANNPIKNIDVMGLYPENIVDGKGRTAYTKEGGYTKYATAAIRRVGNAMMSTRTGMAQWNKMADASHNITINISDERRVSKTASGGTKYELGKSFIKREIGTKSLDVKSIKSADIVIYEGSIESFLENSTSDLANAHRVNTNGIDQVIGAVGVHESVHSTDMENNQQAVDNKFKGASHDIEAVPHQVERQVLDEMGTQNIKPLPLLQVRPIQN